MALILAICLSGSAVNAAADQPLNIEIWKSASCECCGNWVKHLEANGFAVMVNAAEPAALERLKAQVGIGSDVAGCHTAKIGGYVIEGHVPASDIKRLVVGPAENELDIEIVGEIAKMVALGLGANEKQADLNERLTRSVKMVAGVGFEPTTFRL